MRSSPSEITKIREPISPQAERGTNEKSTDLERAAAARSKSLEFFIVPPLAEEILHHRFISAIFGLLHLLGTRPIMADS